MTSTPFALIAQTHSFIFESIATPRGHEGQQRHDPRECDNCALHGTDESRNEPNQETTR